MDQPNIINDNKNKEKRLEMEINDGYTVRIWTDHLFNTITDGNFVINGQGMTFIRSDSDNQITNVLEIDGYKLPIFEFNNGKSDEIIFGCTISNFREVTQTISKGDSFKLQMYQKDPNLYSQVLGSDAKYNSGDQNQRISYQKVNNSGLEIEAYKRPIDKPNCSIPIDHFCEIAKKLTKNIKHSKYINIRVGSKSLRIGKKSPGGITEFQFSIGSIVANDPEQYDFNINSKIIKSISKINKLSTDNATFQVYSEKDRPLKMVFTIGNYGRLTIYLNSTDLE